MPDASDSSGAHTASPATDSAVALLCAFVRLGVRHIVLSPGSRSQALALAAAELERIGAIRLHVRIDERVAGFLALGVGVQTRTPALVITTSGTATANLHPAVLEADASGVPLVALTADRPAELRGIRSNQTTDQPGMYGTAVRLSEDIAAPTGKADEADAAAALAARAWSSAVGAGTGTPGPVHLNLAYREPLSAPIPDLSGLVDLGSPAEVDRVVQRGSDSSTQRADGMSAVPSLSTGSQPGTSTRVEAQRAAGSAPPGDAYPPDRAAAARSEDRDRDPSSGPGPVPAPRRHTREPDSPSRDDLVPGRPVLTLEPGVRTVVIAGHAAGPAAEELARAGGWPLLAEVSSGSRFGPNLVVAYRELLGDADFGGVLERAIVFGHPTLSREVPALLRRDDVEVIVVAPTGTEVYDPARSATIAAAVRVGDDHDAGSPDARAWVGRWVFTSRRLLDERGRASADHVAPDVAAGRSHEPADRLAFARTELAAVRAPVTRAMLADALWRYTWPHDRLVLGASRLIRDLDRTVSGKRIAVHANRGLAGIDGTVSTAIGMALAAPAGAGITRVLLGDLTLLHDVGALAFGVGERRPSLQVVLGNDGGGTIFDGLEVAWSTPAEAMDRVMLTPQSVDLSALAAAYGWGYARAATRGELDQALSAPPDGPSILEVPLPR